MSNLFNFPAAAESLCCLFGAPFLCLPQKDTKKTLFEHFYFILIFINVEKIFFFPPAGGQRCLCKQPSWKEREKKKASQNNNPALPAYHSCLLSIIPTYCIMFSWQTSLKAEKHAQFFVFFFFLKDDILVVPKWIKCQKSKLFLQTRLLRFTHNHSNYLFSL